ncbi:TKL protein kinase [Phytophthora nicotianae P10297]|uniref:TKL protein kinase n=1 Tax=Phytophthora nicotianae P10297 TaxID=1317064 RepID=W2ZME9_PHYNI|nr:TKL protein kinase [Phytophthora nicotianae P10297]
MAVMAILLVGLLVLVLLVHLVEATTYDIMATYLDTNCSSTEPYIVYARQNGGCTDGVCYTYLVDNRAYAVDERASTDCSEEDYLRVMREFYNNSPYIIHELYSDDDCSTFEYAVGFLATNTCLGGNQSAGLYYESSLNPDGSATVIPYFINAGSTETMEGDSSCSSASAGVVAADKEVLANHSCVHLGEISLLYDFFTTDSANTVSSYRWYSSNDPDISSQSGLVGSTSSYDSSSGSIATENRSSSLSSGALAGIIVAAVIIVIAIIFAICFCKRRSQAMRADERFTRTTSPISRDTVSGQRGLWNDEVITAKRIPRNKVKVKKLLSRGAFGEVYSGVFYQRRVAVKMLPSSTRTSLQHVNAFLTEAKITATMDHPHIVPFIGVAWDSLSDLCVALEFMEGGDLRALLNKYEASNHHVGFDRQKTAIALHVCHALAYLHSLASPIIHRDLKSKNILLNGAMEAKLSDFGTSRQRLDETMTAGVGTSLWMAPEVMLGERYDEKADMFSFGVVLSELDVHTLPYAQARKRSRESEGRELTDPSLLQRVATGEIRVEFSYFSPRSIVNLGHACVSVDPGDRPTAAEALYRLQLALAKELV